MQECGLKSDWKKSNFVEDHLGYWQWTSQASISSLQLQQRKLVSYWAMLVRAQLAEKELCEGFFVFVYFLFDFFLFVCLFFNIFISLCPALVSYIWQRPDLGFLVRERHWQIGGSRARSLWRLGATWHCAEQKVPDTYKGIERDGFVLHQRSLREES